jgi:hypothetical protein
MKIHLQRFILLFFYPFCGTGTNRKSDSRKNKNMKSYPGFLIFIGKKARGKYGCK